MRGLRGWIVVLVVLAAAAFLLGRSSGPSDTGAGGASADVVRAERSAMPCRVDLTWRVGEVDPRGRLDRADVRAAARRAVDFWEEVAGRPLFRHDPTDGLSIHLRYDQQLHELNDRQRALDGTQAALADSAESLRVDAERLDRRERELGRRIRRHNERVEELNDGGGAPEDVRREIERARRDLRREQESLENLRASLERRGRRLEAAREDFGEAVEAYNRSPGVRLPVRVGDYSEDVTTRGDRVLSVDDRAVTVRSPSDRAALANVIAHELGHALGLGHVRDSAAVMAEVRETGYGRGPLVARAADRNELRRRCPDLVRTP